MNKLFNTHNVFNGKSCRHIRNYPFFLSLMLFLPLFISLSCKKENKHRNDRGGAKKTIVKNSKRKKNKNSKRKNLKRERIEQNENFRKNIQDSKPDGSIILTEIFHGKKGIGTSSIPDKVKRAITVRELADIIIKETPRLSDEEFNTIKSGILESREFNPGKLGIYLTESGGNTRIANLGYQLITISCVKKTTYFKPESFFVAFAKLGFNAEPYINKIIFNTNSDFIRAWAAELYVEIFYHNADKADGRLRKLEKVMNIEKQIILKLKKIFSDPLQVKKVLESESLARQIRNTLGNENRYSLKLMQIIKLLDSMNKKNLYAVSKKILKTIEKDSYDYNILNFLNGKVLEMPKIPIKVKLKYYANAVFSENNQNTYHWVPKENGGFALRDIRRAFFDDNEQKMVAMLRIFREIICTVLKGKLLLGQGNKELELLRYFYFSKWNKKKIQWSDSLIVIDNNTGVSIHLALLKKMKAMDVLTGAAALNQKNLEDRKEKFLVPPQASFVWFAPDGKFIIQPDAQLPNMENHANFKTREFNLESLMNITIF